MLILIRNLQFLRFLRIVSILKERVNLAYAGLKMNLKISEIEEFIEFHKAINAQAVADDSDVKAATDEK